MRAHPPLALEIAAARGVAALSRRLGAGGGTTIPGRLLAELDRGAIDRLAARLATGTVVVSATNGKTTTTAMAAEILRSRHRLAYNAAGANLVSGVASALLTAGDADLGLFEVDEFWLPSVTAQLEPRALLLANLFRDQLDRYGELELIADRWAGVVAAQAARGADLVLNADDPLVADLGRDVAGVLYFGVGDTSLALPGLQHAADSKHCRRCGSPYVYDAILLGHLGHYHCPTGDATRPQPSVVAREVRLEGIRAASFTLGLPGGERSVRLPLPGLYNVYNALAAAALATSLGAGPDDVAAGLEATAPAFGRAETVRLGDREMAILLVKNPAGANEVLRTLTLESGEHDLLAILNDNIADGRDVSWVWDADFEVLGGHVRRVTCAGTRAEELAVRMKYAGIDPDRIVVVPGLEQALDAARADGDGPLYALPTYTAMLALRDLLTRRGVTASSWA